MGNNNKSKLIKGIIFQSEGNIPSSSFSDLNGDGYIKLGNKTYMYIWHDGSHSHYEMQLKISEKYDIINDRCFAISESNGQLDVNDINRVFSGEYSAYKPTIIAKSKKYFRDSINKEIKMNINQFNKIKDKAKRTNKSFVDTMKLKDDLTSDVDIRVVEDAIYWVKRDGKPLTIKNVFRQIDRDMKGFYNEEKKQDIIEYLKRKYNLRDSMKDALTMGDYTLDYYYNKDYYKSVENYVDKKFSNTDAEGKKTLVGFIKRILKEKFKFSDSIKDRTNTTVRQFRNSDLDEEGSWLGTTEWGTPKGSMYVYKKDGKIVVEAKGGSIGDPIDKYKFNTLQELNRWLLKFEDSIKDVEPNKDESKEEFIARFMNETKSEYPDEKQRYAVANSYWKKSKDSVKDDKQYKDKIIEYNKPYNYYIIRNLRGGVIGYINGWDVKSYEDIYKRIDTNRLETTPTKDSINDEDLTELSQEEMRAIEDYKKAISNTKDVKLLNLYSHILKEEIEHLEELNNAKSEVGDSVKDGIQKYIKYSCVTHKINEVKSLLNKLGFSFEPLRTSGVYTEFRVGGDALADNKWKQIDDMILDINSRFWGSYK